MNTPFLKWPGGKRWVASTIADLIRPRLSGTYYEPFLGGGAVFFELSPLTSVLSDINPDLINTYQMVQTDPEGVIRRVKSYPVSKNQYYSIRDNTYDDPLDQAARFLYLNRTAFGGMYRLNKAGKFNVPYGGGERTPAPLWKNNLVSQASVALSNTQLIVRDFEEALSAAGAGDAVYCDPTYTVAHDRNGFIRYNESNFSWNDQKRLAVAAAKAEARGAFVVITNAHHPSLRELYPTARERVLTRASRMSANATKRRKVHEYLLVMEGN
jgi:DNA adenine methylase